MSNKSILFIANLVGAVVETGMLFVAFKAGELKERKKWQQDNEEGGETNEK